MTKQLEEMTTDERIAWAAGVLTLSIGAGDFSSTLWMVVTNLERVAFDRGVKAAEAEQARRRRKVRP